MSGLYYEKFEYTYYGWLILFLHFPTNSDRRLWTEASHLLILILILQLNQDDDRRMPK
jgi:hypothetical protein